jgi:hypothetical protein
MPEKIDSCATAAASVSEDEMQSNLSYVQSETTLDLNGDLEISDYLHDVPPTKKVAQDISTWMEKQRETTRTKLVIWMVKLLGCSMLGTFVLTGAVAFSPQADKELIKDLVPQLITTQVTLLGVAFGFYFSNKED